MRGIFNVIAQGIVGIILAINGAGIWSLVFSKLAGTIVGSIILIVAVHWKPSITFSIIRIRKLFKYSSKFYALIY